MESFNILAEFLSYERKGRKVYLETGKMKRNVFGLELLDMRTAILIIVWKFLTALQKISYFVEEYSTDLPKI